MNDSYVYYLETRVSYLEAQLQSNNVPFAPAEVFDSNAQAHATLPSPTGGAAAGGGGGVGGGGPAAQASSGSKADVPSGGAAAGTGAGTAQEQKQHDTEKIENLMSNIGMVSVQGASDPRYLGSTSGISFARVVFAAVKNSVSSASSERGGVRPSKPIAISMTGSSSNDATMRDSFFGLHTKPTISQAPFPDRSLGFKLVNLYFEHANPQIPILHRGEFMALFDRVYASEEGERKAPRELYMLNIVFAIGAGIYLRDADSDDTQKEDTPATSVRGDSSGRRATAARKKFEPDGHQHQPEEYHASAIVHLESFLGSSPASDRPDGFGGGLEELQAVLLLAGFALLRPVAPGLWYIIGVAVRLGIDLGLHYEDGVGIDPGRPEDGTDPAAADAEDVEMTMGKVTGGGGSQGPALKTIDARERGRREWVRDLRRRLWWW
ncbi:MAG: Fungal specific transcription factor [Sclerophora amabilis]|nr:MAG: Fungal specific transcription factor [Sclerophora amabilis]